MRRPSRMDTPQRRPLPSSPPALLVVGLAGAGWGGLWVLVIPAAMLPVAYVVPLAVGFWTARRSALWLSAAVFAGLTVAKAALVAPAANDTAAWVAATLACIAGGTAATLWLLYRSEGAPAEEPVPPAGRAAGATGVAAPRPREDAREAFLQLLLRGLTRPGPREVECPAVLDRILSLVGPPAETCAVLSIHAGTGELVAATGAAAATVAKQWPADGPLLAEAVASRRTVAFVDCPPGVLALPGQAMPAGGVLVAPGGPAATTALVIVSRVAHRWTPEQLAIATWAAAQVGLWLEARGREVRPRVAPPSEPRAAAPRRILLVEDHADTGAVLTRVLRTEGHAVTHVHTAAEAMERFAAEPFDLVIADLGLPGESGAVLMERIRRERPGLPGICVTGYEVDPAGQPGLFSAHLTKPVDIRQLHAAIARACPPAGNPATG